MFQNRHQRLSLEDAPLLQSIADIYNNYLRNWNGDWLCLNRPYLSPCLTLCKLQLTIIRLQEIVLSEFCIRWSGMAESKIGFEREKTSRLRVLQVGPSAQPHYKSCNLQSLSSPFINLLLSTLRFPSNLCERYYQLNIPILLFLSSGTSPAMSSIASARERVTSRIAT